MACRNVFDVVHPDNSAESVANSQYPLLSAPTFSDPNSGQHQHERQYQHQSAHAIAHQPPKWILYDLKGSTVGRRASPHSKVAKDLDLMSLTPTPLLLGQVARQFLLEVLRRDVAFLGKLVLLGKGGYGSPTVILHMGIIDFLQRYTFRKWLETLVKGLYSDASKISAVHPDRYARRMIDFIAKYVA
eukprot:gene1785-2096_t